MPTDLAEWGVVQAVKAANASESINLGEIEHALTLEPGSDVLEDWFHDRGETLLRYCQSVMLAGDLVEETTDGD